jgi:hypothetical protein
MTQLRSPCHETMLLHLHLIRTPEPISAIRLGYFRRHLEQISVIVPLSKSMSAFMLRLPRLSRRFSRLAHVKNCSAKNQAFYPSVFFCVRGLSKARYR